jgi:hypothetical protein
METLFTVGQLPDGTAPVINDAEVRLSPFLGQKRPGHTILVRHGAGGWHWAHVVNMVTGWKVVAAGIVPSAGLYVDALAAAEYVAEQARGADGDGFDRLSHDAYMQQGSSTVAHLRQEADPTLGYCGAALGRPAVFDTSQPGHAEQHCIKCDRVYRAAHYGRVAVTY